MDLALTFRADGRVALRVKDDGRGASDPSGGFGLTGIRERAEQPGGSARCETAPRRGFALEIEVPA